MSMDQGTLLETVLLLALPASGKSEIRKYLAALTPETCQRDFHMGPTVQLDDFPYVHMMRRIDDELARMQGERIFFSSPEKPFRDGRDWGTLIELVNEDYADLREHKVHRPSSAALHLLERLDAASERAGAPARLSALPSKTTQALADSLEKEARELLDEKNQNSSQDLNGKTLVIEFARGGAQGSTFPLTPPYGYAYSLSRLSREILTKARILYVWVTPEESRRKNEERTDPNDPGSILHHGVPIEVMLKEYGCDDMDWLESKCDRPGMVKIQTPSSQSFYLPIARFDNRIDKTSFIRKDRAQWKTQEVQAIHDGLQGALTKLAEMR